MNSEARPRRADAARNRERVLASAEAVLARDGLSASMRAIAADAGVGLGTIYRNFPTQEALYQAIIVRRTEALIAEAAELAAHRTPARRSSATSPASWSTPCAPRPWPTCWPGPESTPSPAWPMSAATCGTPSRPCSTAPSRQARSGPTCACRS